MTERLPSRVRLLVIGGGIHGVGILHDMACRGWQDAVLIEKGKLASGTSSKSTKLIHGGLRYLKNVRDFGLVAESLAERKFLLEMAPDLVKPIKLYLPVIQSQGMPWWMVKSGLMLYDLLARSPLRHRSESRQAFEQDVPIFNPDRFSKLFSYWDAQTDDMGLVHRVACSALKMGGSIYEHHQVVHLNPDPDGWRVKIKRPDGSLEEISALYVVNAAGPWAHRLLEQSQLAPKFEAINVEGTHLLLPDMGLKAGVFLQSPQDGRMFFVLPWQRHTLIGTTETLFEGNPDDLVPPAEGVQYLIDKTNEYLKVSISEKDVLSVFSGLRWLVADQAAGLSRTSRSYSCSVHDGTRGLLLTLYGGKLTTYRKLAEEIGDRLCRHFGEDRECTTRQASSWCTKDEASSLPPVEERF